MGVNLSCPQLDRDRVPSDKEVQPSATSASKQAAHATGRGPA